MKNTFLLLLLLVQLSPIFSQKGKDGILSINTPTIVNEFATVISDININDTQLTLSQTTLNDNNRFNNILSPGDLILIIQMQGASVDASAEPWTGNGIYGLPYSAQWGTITNYNDCGNYEYAEIASINSNSTVTLRCAIQHNYTANGKIQVVRVPRYESLTINDSLNTEQWNGNTGGISVIEVERNLSIASSGVINATGKGFRGGLATLRNNIHGAGEFASIEPTHGGMKGEGIAGYSNDYTIMGGQFGKGAAANAGGGSTSHNSGGGGGANAGDISNWIDGVGIPNTTYNTAWGLETPSISNINSSGGGRGGYTYSANNQNANLIYPDSSIWGGDKRRNNGGLGGRPLNYSLGKLFFGGGGGAGELNDSENEGGNGGNAGGLILIKVYGNITGSGKIIANGEDGEDIFTNNPPTFSYAGNDGSGGAGAGGTIKIENTLGATIANINISAKGGNGGSQILQRGILFLNLIDEAEGPGGGGGGGFISIPSNLATINVNGGINGTTNSDALSEFPPNGATSGGDGLITPSNNNLNITALNDTICYGNITTLNATLNSTLPTNSTVIWYDENYNMIGTGLNYTTGIITNDTIFHVGICPENTSVMVQVIIGSSFTADTSNLQTINEHCNLSDGSISGIVINGGALPLTYQWNGVSSTSLDLTNLNNGPYQLIVTDNDGCSSEIGIFNILNESGPVIDSSNYTYQNESCNSNNGSLSGITVSGGTTPYIYNWNSISSTLDIQNLSSGNYNVLVTDTYGCSDSSGVYIITNEAGPAIDTTSISIVPESCELSNGSISSINTNGTATPFTYNWSNNSNSIDINNLSSGNYQLIVSDANACLDSIIISINEIGFPTAGFLTTDSMYFTNEQILIADIASNDVVTWNYDNGNGTNSSSPTPILSYSTPGDYTICQSVSNSSNCEAIYCATITIVEENLPLVIPNVFTPNNDGRNELFIIQNLTENGNLKIFDRWGNLVFKAAPYLNNWSGKTTNGMQLSEGSYYYIVEDLNETKTGHFSLIK